jgi:hypothetical protein
MQIEQQEGEQQPLDEFDVLLAIHICSEITSYKGLLS